MVVRRTVHHLRTRPHDERRFVAAVVAVSFAGIVFLIWSVFFFQRIQGTIATTATSTTEELIENAPEEDSYDLRAQSASLEATGSINLSEFD